MEPAYLEIARQEARTAHSGQVYIEGFDEYSFFERHLEYVAQKVTNMGYGPEYIAVAYLHDILEDTDTTPEQLFDIGMPKNVVDAVEALTYRKGSNPDDYLARVCSVPLAVPVKFVDSTQNLETTLANKNALEAETYNRRKAKYDHNLAVLRPLLAKIGKCV